MASRAEIITKTLIFVRTVIRIQKRTGAYDDHKEIPVSYWCYQRVLLYCVVNSFFVDCNVAQSVRYKLLALIAVCGENTETEPNLHLD